jgi:hypothetical protein
MCFIKNMSWANNSDSNLYLYIIFESPFIYNFNIFYNLNDKGHGDDEKYEIRENWCFDIVEK